MFEKLKRKVKKISKRYYIKYIIRPARRKFAHLKEGDEKDFRYAVKNECMRVIFVHYLIPLTIILLLSVNAIIYWGKVWLG